MMFLPSKFEKTYKGTVGKWPQRLRILSALAALGSLALYQWVSPSAGFLTLLISVIVHGALIGREHYIESIYRAGSITDLRFHLLPFNREFVLRSIEKDSVWRGDEVDPDVTRMLQEIDNNKTQLVDNLNKWAQDLFDAMEVKPQEKDKN